MAFSASVWKVSKCQAHKKWQLKKIEPKLTQTFFTYLHKFSFVMKCIGSSYLHTKGKVAHNE